MRQACQDGVAGELANVALYDELLATVTEADVLDVFNRRRTASLERHLPAFRSCA